VLLLNNRGEVVDSDEGNSWLRAEQVL
jgi:hypothetical protein